MNPALRERQTIVGNLLSRLHQQPLVTALLGFFCMVLGLLIFVVFQRLGQHHHTMLLAGLQRWPFLVWSTIFLLCLAMQRPAWRREWVAARAGWMAAWLEMPEAMQRWSRWRSFGWAMLQSLGLLAALAWVNFLEPGKDALHSSHYLLAVVVPLVVWIVLPWTVGRPTPSDRPVRAPEAHASSHRNPSPEPVIAQWHWQQYRSQRWRSGTRWSLGLLLLLIPAGAAALQVGVALMIGLALVQWSQFWSAGLSVIVQGSALTRALPLTRRAFAARLSRLPMISVAVLLPAIALVSAAAGMAWGAALLTSLLLGSALMLYLAAVLAWRDEPSALRWRPLAALLVFGLLSTSMPFLSPMIWLLLLAGLIRLIVKEAG
jgi:hypothetical protein